MPAPAGAQKVDYTIAIYENPEGTPPQPIECIITFSAPLGEGNQDTHQHAAIEAGADAMLTYLEAQFPGLPIVKARSYTGHLDGDAWPGA